MDSLLITNAYIHTMSGKDIPNGYIFSENGKIKSVASGSPDNLENTRMLNMGCAKVLDVKGAGVYPGFVDAHTHLGMWEDGLAFEGDDGNEETDPVTPQLRAVDAINPLDRCFSEALEAGVTSVVTGPGSANAIGGQMAAVKTYGTRIDDMIIKAPLAIKMALGENPKNVYHGKDETPSTRMATASLIRNEFLKAKRYADDIARAEDSDDCDMPEYDMKCEALLPALKREIQVHIHAHRADDIYTAIRISKEFGLDYVIVHGTEGYLIKDGLKMENARVLSGPILSDRCKPELKNQTPSAPGILSSNGILTAIITDHPVVPVQYLPMCAAIAVREGMEREEALKAITVNPARICGIDGRVGSIRAGMDADMAVFEGDPLDIKSKPEYVIAGGKIAAGCGKR